MNLRRLPFPLAHWLPRGLTLAVWLLAAGSVVFWGLRLSQRSAPLTTPAALPSASAMDADRVAAWLGAPSGTTPAATASAPAVASSLKLLGVVAGTSGGEGVALISIDGAPPKPYPVGRTVQGDWVVQHVSLRRVDVGPRGGPVRETLQMPVLPPASTRPSADAMAQPPVTPATIQPPTPAPPAPVPTIAPQHMPMPSMAPAIITQRDGNLAPSTLPQAVPNQ